MATALYSPAAAHSLGGFRPINPGPCPTGTASYRARAGAHPRRSHPNRTRTLRGAAGGRFTDEVQWQRSAVATWYPAEIQAPSLNNNRIADEVRIIRSAPSPTDEECPPAALRVPRPVQVDRQQHERGEQDRQASDVLHAAPALQRAEDAGPDTSRSGINMRV